ncbi:hypothetical protein GPECTOR_36g69 [Gonium pectorale]|uniref:Uncharacterized protein n=1 Tax=Gonium pectorale TaxID=33097 RepID=A0A150GCP5_GONPE|nr:hypothetical protein GPECTOR_36g69 [Gonium pectorale]|eukprot:KXZ47345.1 hypothetical protein GPECTOR_36g69 [Gonium pectorale]
MDCTEMSADPYLQQQIVMDVRTAIAEAFGLPNISSVAVPEVLCGAGSSPSSGSSRRRLVGPDAAAPEELRRAAASAAATAAVGAGEHGSSGGSGTAAHDECCNSDGATCADPPVTCPGPSPGVRQDAATPRAAVAPRPQPASEPPADTLSAATAAVAASSDGAAAATVLHRRRLAAAATSAAASGVTFQIVATFPAQAATDGLLSRLADAPSDVSWLFAARPALVAAYGVPSVVSLGFAVRLAALDAADCPPRPDVEAYAPAFVGRREFPVLLRFAEPFNASGCGAGYGCLLAASRVALPIDGSLRPLDPSGSVVSLRLALLAEGPLGLVLRDDPCDPATRPAFLNLTADLTPPSAALSLAAPPSLANASFVVLADFSEPVLPFAPEEVRSVGCRVAAMEWLSPARLRITAEGVAGTTASLQLSSFAYSDWAGNAGLPSEPLYVAAFAGGLAFRTPAAFVATAERGGGWAALAVLGGDVTGWAGRRFSRGLRAAPPPPPPPPGLQQLYENGTISRYILDAGLLSATPYLLYGAVTSGGGGGGSNATAPSLQPSPLLNYSVGLAWNVSRGTDPRIALAAAWDDAVSAALLAAGLLLVAAVAHAAIAYTADRDMRALGFSVYAAWPKLLLMAAAATGPPLLFAAARLLSLEASRCGGARAVGAAPWLLLGVAGGVALAALAWLAYVALVAARRVWSRPMVPPYMYGGGGGYAGMMLGGGMMRPRMPYPGYPSMGGGGLAGGGLMGGGVPGGGVYGGGGMAGAGMVPEPAACTATAVVAAAGPVAEGREQADFPGSGGGGGEEEGEPGRARRVGRVRAARRRARDALAGVSPAAAAAAPGWGQAGALGAAAVGYAASSAPLPIGHMWPDAAPMLAPPLGRPSALNWLRAGGAGGGGGGWGLGGLGRGAAGRMPGPRRVHKADPRSLFRVRYGWVVADTICKPAAADAAAGHRDAAVADASALAAARAAAEAEAAAAESHRARQRRYLCANWLSLLRAVLLAGLMGGWAADAAEGRMAQCAAALAVAAAWLSYLVAVRPYAQVWVLAAEAAMSGLECAVAALAVVAQAGVRMSPPAATLATVALLLLLGSVVVVEAVRAVLTGRSVWRRLRAEAERQAEAEVAGAKRGAS